MITVTTYGTFEETLSGASGRVKGIAKKIKEMIIDFYPEVVEVPWPKQGIVGYGVGPKKMSEHFCYIGLYREHVNLGFYYGAELPDPEGLMEGTGKKLRHIKVRDIEALDNPTIRTLLQKSLEERRAFLGL